MNKKLEISFSCEYNSHSLNLRYILTKDIMAITLYKLPFTIHMNPTTCSSQSIA